MLHTLSKNLVVCQADRTQQGAPPSASPRIPPPTHGTRPAPPGTPPPFDLELEASTALRLGGSVVPA